MYYEEIFRALERHGVRYLVIGGIAVNIYGFSRVTGDLDIIVSFEKGNLKKLVDLLLKNVIPGRFCRSLRY